MVITPFWDRGPGVAKQRCRRPFRASAHHNDETGRTAQAGIRTLDSRLLFVIERNGVFKAYMYKD
jgi:hypothetical protein